MRLFPPSKRKRKHSDRLDRLAESIADENGLLYEYSLARLYGYSPLEALDDWDLLTPEAKARLDEAVDTN